MNVGHILTTHSIQDVQIVVWFPLWAAAPAAEEKRHLETCLRPLSLWAPFYSNSATAVDNWMCFGFFFFNINIYIYYFDMFLLDKSLRPFESFEKNEIYVTFFFLFAGFQHVMNWSRAYFEKKTKNNCGNMKEGLITISISWNQLCVKLIIDADSMCTECWLLWFFFSDNDL